MACSVVVSSEPRLAKLLSEFGGVLPASDRDKFGFRVKSLSFMSFVEVG